MNLRPAPAESRATATHLAPARLSHLTPLVAGNSLEESGRIIDN